MLSHNFDIDITAVYGRLMEAQYALTSIESGLHHDTMTMLRRGVTYATSPSIKTETQYIVDHALCHFIPAMGNKTNIRIGNSVYDVHRCQLESHVCDATKTYLMKQSQEIKLVSSQVTWRPAFTTMFTNISRLSCASADYAAIRLSFVVYEFAVTGSVHDGLRGDRP